MPGNKAQLQTALQAIFENLDPDKSAEDAASEMADAIDNYLDTVKVQTAIPVQVNTGSGTGATTSIANLQ